MKFLKTSLVVLGALIVCAFAGGEEEPTYRIQETHTMETPITDKEFVNWETRIGSVF